MKILKENKLIEVDVLKRHWTTNHTKIEIIQINGFKVSADDKLYNMKTSLTGK